MAQNNGQLKDTHPYSNTQDNQKVNHNNRDVCWIVDDHVGCAVSCNAPYKGESKVISKHFWLEEWVTRETGVLLQSLHFDWSTCTDTYVPLVVQAGGGVFMYSCACVCVREGVWERMGGGIKNQRDCVYLINYQLFCFIEGVSGYVHKHWRHECGWDVLCVKVCNLLTNNVCNHQPRRNYLS